VESNTYGPVPNVKRFHIYRSPLNGATPNTAVYGEESSQARCMFFTYISGRPSPAIERHSATVDNSPSDNAAQRTGCQDFGESISPR